MYTLVLLRHGQSTYNAEKRFCGWHDAPLTPQGIQEATRAGTLLHTHGFVFDHAYTSYLSRAIKTLWLSLEAMQTLYLPITHAWQLNERHYGDLQGRTHDEARAEVGEEQVHLWRRSFLTPPPLLDHDDPRHPRFDERYQHINPELLPAGESLAMTIDRIMPYWTTEIAPRIQAGQKLLISAHGNSLRAIVKHLKQISDDDIIGYEIPTGVPLVFTLDQNLYPIESYYITTDGKQPL